MVLMEAGLEVPPKADPSPQSLQDEKKESKSEHVTAGFPQCTHMGRASKVKEKDMHIPSLLFGGQVVRDLYSSESWVYGRSHSFKASIVRPLNRGDLENLNYLWFSGGCFDKV